MNSMITLEKVLDKAYTMSRDCHDKLVKVKDVSFRSLDTVYIGDEPHNLKPVAQQSVANRLGIPIQYLRRCPADIQKLNLNHWIKHERNEELFFRFKADEVRAVFTPRYIPTDNIEVLEKLRSLDYPSDTRVQSFIDEEFMTINIPDGRKSFTINSDRMTPGISISNSEVGLASLSIAAFILRLVCTNGMISKTKVSASYRHVSGRILEQLPSVFNDVSLELGKKREQFELSLESRVEHPEMTIQNFNAQFQLNQQEKEAVEWALPLEYGFTMFNMVNVYTKASHFEGLSAENRYRLQKVGGGILGMVKETIN